MSEPVPELVLERYILGIASPAERARVEASAEAMARAIVLRRENDGILAADPPAVVAERVRQRAGARRASPVLWLAPAIAMACAAVLFAVQPAEVVQPAQQLGDAQPEIILAKGGPAHLSLYRKRDSSSEKLDNNAIAHKGDTVQVAYMAGESTYGAIVSVDGRGSTTVHTPLEGDGRLSQRGEVLLPRAYTLDDAPKFECFVFVASKQAVNVERLAALLHASPEIDAGRLRTALGDTVDIDIFTLRKDQ